MVTRPINTKPRPNVPEFDIVGLVAVTPQA